MDLNGAWRKLRFPSSVGNFNFPPKRDGSFAVGQMTEKECGPRSDPKLRHNFGHNLQPGSSILTMSLGFALCRTKRERIFRPALSLR
jgi:hypothetical protein